MKSVFVLCLIAFFGLTVAETTLYPRGCIYALGKCVRECEVGTHAYTTGCGYLTPEATCENPNPATDMRARICDYSACYCDPPTVRNKVNNKCVPLEECPNLSLLDIITALLPLKGCRIISSVSHTIPCSSDTEEKPALHCFCSVLSFIWFLSKAWLNGFECDEGIHAYSISCGYRKPEPTCDNPHPTIDQRGYFCDYFTCDCFSPTVRNKLNDKCVPLNECPK
ncbi:unnamed protein product [Danaus chrysippus]|uniref:(African queen) hypothetical protein n=1 Tax=Danaus chrysippus TaxID=151541 RepID=A0A8J2QQC9_9NEOP|nr:unnamed protein product [Danaus chrysippus]